jgi:ElaB/YqjD/DUF883 family membrane-anchored ribosome-binding protein
MVAMSRESEAEVLRRIEATRERMGETIERIGDQVHPDRVQHELKARAREQVDELKHNAKRKAKNTMDDVQHEMRETTRGIWDTIRDNPIPAGMVGVGLAWLMANGSRDTDDRVSSRSSAFVARPGPGVAHRYPPVPSASYGYDEGLDEDLDYDAGHDDAGSGAMANAREKGEHAMDAAREKGEEVVDEVREKGQEMAAAARSKGRELSREARHGIHEARETAMDWASDAGYHARRAEHRVEDAVRDNPFAAGAVAMALGLAAGLMIPESDREREIMGSTRDKLMDKAESKARKTAGQAREKVRETAGRAAQGAVDEMWPESGSGSESGSESGIQRMVAEGGTGNRSPVSEPGR